MSLKKQLNESKDAQAENALVQIQAKNFEVKKENALTLIGGIGAINSLAVTLSAEVMRALETMQTQKVHESLGYQRFADFLDNSSHSPMSKSTYYERKKILDNEGDIIFDLLNGLSMPISKRKLLGKGNIQVDGEMVIVIDGEEETEIELNDRTRLLETLTALADRSTTLDQRLKKRDKDIEKLTGKITELDEENDRILAYKKSDFQDNHAIAVLQITSAFTTLQSEAEKLSKAEKQKSAPNTFELIAEWQERLSVAYERNESEPKAKSKKKGKKAGSITEVVKDMNDDDLAGLMD